MSHIAMEVYSSTDANCKGIGGGGRRSSDEEKNVAIEHRKQLEEFDPEAYCRKWRGMANKHFGHCKNLGDLISHIDSLIADLLEW